MQKRGPTSQHAPRKERDTGFDQPIGIKGLMSLWSRETSQTRTRDVEKQFPMLGVTSLVEAGDHWFKAEMERREGA